MGEREDRMHRSSSGGGPRGGRPDRNRFDRNRPDHRRQSGRSGGQFYLPRGSIVYILDILQHGGVDKPGHTWNPICQVIQVPEFRIFEMYINRGKIIQLQEKVTTGNEDCPLGKVHRRLKYSDLTRTSLDMIQTILPQYIAENEARYVAFFNNAGPITIKRHTLEVLPGVGKKLMWDIVSAREKEPFKSFDDIKIRVPGFKPQEVIAKRIVEELDEKEEEKHYLFVKHHKPNEMQQHSGPLQNNPFHRRM